MERTGSAGRTKTNGSWLLRCLQDKKTWLREAESDLSLTDKIKSHMLPHTHHAQRMKRNASNHKYLVGSWLLTSFQTHWVTSGRITLSNGVHTSSKHKSQNQKLKAGSQLWTQHSQQQIQLSHISRFTFHLTTIGRSITPQHLHTT